MKYTTSVPDVSAEAEHRPKHERIGEIVSVIYVFGAIAALFLF
jgi:hypothetical protein